jgi:proteasome accessory factor B
VPEKVDAATRLFNLACALLYTREGLTKHQIFSRVSGYSETYEPGTKNVSLNKHFDRDKIDLKRSGIQWIAFQPPSALEDNQEIYYKVPKQEFLWPSNLTLTKRQVAILNLASSVWNQASLSRDAANAALRVRGLGESGDIAELTTLAPRIRTHHSSFTALTEAIERGLEVKFGYRKPTSNSVDERVFRPWQLQNISGQWLVLGFDSVRNEPRSFLLRRIVTDVKHTNSESQQPSATEVAAGKASLDEFISENEATLRIKPETEAWFRFEMDDVAHAKRDEVTFNFMDVHLLADELRQYAGQIEVLRPEGLKELIEAGFRKVVESHHG